MNPASQLTDPEAQILCAEVLGWTGIIDGRGFNQALSDKLAENYGGKWNTEIPNFPGSIDACQALIDYMRERGWNCTLDFWAKHEPSCYFWKRDQDTDTSPEDGPTLARAIVNAFLISNGRATA